LLVTDRPLTAAALTRRAIESIDAGAGAVARQLLAEALAQDAAYEPAWLWFASVCADPAERKFCLARAMHLNPASPAGPALRRLRRVAPIMPPELAAVVDPELPPDLIAPRALGPIPTPPRRHLLAGAIAALLALGVVLAAVAVRRPSVAPIHVAIALPLSGSGAAQGQEMVASARLLLASRNAQGGLAGRPLVLDVYDDRNDPATAQQVAHQIVAAGQALFVIGPASSSTAIAADPIYAAAGIPVITSTATADQVTADNPWSFRMLFDNTTEGRLIAAYAQHERHADHLTILHGTMDYGQSLAAGVRAAFTGPGGVTHDEAIDVAGDPAATQASIDHTVADLRRDPNPGLIVIAMQSAPAKPLLIALNHAGIVAPMIGGDALGDDSFLRSFADQPEDQASPGVFTNGLYAAAPLYRDSVTSDALRWYTAFRAAYGVAPGWRGATTYDAAIAGTDAAVIALAHASALPAQRTALRDALAAMTTPAMAPPGLLGPILFDHTRSARRAVNFGVASGHRFASAPIQYQLYAGPAGTTVTVGDQRYTRQRIVFSGIKVNEISGLNLADQVFTADFFLWLKYPGDATAAKITFVNAVNPTLALGDPITTSTGDGLTYQLFRIKGQFTAPLPFQDFPFDTQHLTIAFQNQALSSAQLVYAIDPTLVATSQAVRLSSGRNAAQSINAIPNWQAQALSYYQAVIGSTARMGDPTASAGSGGVDYSVFTADLTIDRDLPSFLIKNLLPLLLLAAVTYVSLFFPPEDMSTRVSFGITGILTSVVLLNNVTASLPDVSYTVAIEWVFYAFILLSAGLILVGLWGTRWHRQGRLVAVHRLNVAARIAYLLTIVAVALAYLVRYAGHG
jgi:ABC-type branched-subunit amino acid transport system substrate-binding protein